MSPGSLGTLESDQPGDCSPGNAHHEDEAVGQLQAGGSRRRKACDPCRGLKVRCIYDPSDADAPCQRCKKSGRPCVEQTPMRNRKPRKRTVNRVSELEKKIDLLTASLHGKAEAGPRLNDGTSEGGLHPQSDYERHSAPVSTPLGTGAPCRTENTPGSSDIMKRSLISPAKADELLVRYNTQMVRHMPAVIFPPDLTAMALHETRPILFLAVMAAAAYETPELQRQLNSELTRVFAEKIMVRAEKNLELIQALQVAVIWYWLPDHYNELQFYQLTFASITMAIDIGLGRRLPERKPIPYGFYAFGQTCNPVTPDPVTLESRRAWLTCYFLASNAALIMRRPLLLGWTRFMAESLHILRTSADRSSMDEYFCALVWTQRIGEEAGQHHSMDDPDYPTDGLRTVYSLRKLDEDLRQFRASLRQDLLQETLKMLVAALPLYTYGPALHGDGADNNQNEPYPAAPSRAFRGVIMSDSVALTTANVNAVSGCLSNINMILETFLSMDAAAIRCLPNFNYMRPVYAVTMLIRIYLSVSEDPELSNTIKRSELRVEPCIDALIHQFRAAAAGDRCRPTAKFLVVLLMLKNFFLKKSEQISGKHSSGVSAPEQQNARQSTNTPLHLLSHAAASQGVQSHTPFTSTTAVPSPYNCTPRQQGHSEMHEPSFHQTCSGAGTEPLSNAGDLSAFDTDFLTALSVQDFAFSLGLGFGSGPMTAFPMGTATDFDAATGPQNSGLRGFGQVQDLTCDVPRGSEQNDSWGSIPPFHV